MARNANQKKEGMFSRMISVVGGGEEGEQGERSEGLDGAESATTMLKSEHDEVRQLFKEFESASEGARSSRKRIADEVSQKLDVHAQIEEKIFYPACRNLQDEEARKMVGESVEEHLIVKRLISELAGLDASDETFESKFTVLKENVEHHADEEERDLFPIAEKELGDERLEELGTQMAQLKQRLMTGAEGGQSRGRSSGGGARGSGRGSSSQSRGRSRQGAAGGAKASRSRSGGSSSSRSRSGGSSNRSSGSRSRSSSGGSSSGSRSRSSGRSSSRSRSSKKK